MYLTRNFLFLAESELALATSLKQLPLCSSKFCNYMMCRLTAAVQVPNWTGLIGWFNYLATNK